MNKFTKIAVYGGGSWGCALACQVARCHKQATIFLRDHNIVQEILTHNTNKKYLGNILLPNNVKASNKLEEIINYEVIIISVPSSAFIETIELIKKLGLLKETILLIATKGFSSNPTELLSDRFQTLLPNNKFAFIAGPNFAIEVAQNMLTSATIASLDINVANKLKDSLSSENFFINAISDIITIQIASAVKNIIAIKSGLYEAKHYGKNARAGLICEALNEIKILSQALGGMKDSLLEPGVIGDLILTCYSQTSRNTQFGYQLGTSKNKEKFLKEYPFLVEGRHAAKLILDFIAKYDLHLPLISSVALELGYL